MTSFLKKIKQNYFENLYVLSFIVFGFQLFKFVLFKDSNLIILNGDAKFYIGALENLFNSGTYQYQHNFSGRMPGFLPLYIPIRLLFNQQLTLALLVFIQLLFFSIATVYFSIVSTKHFNKSLFFTLMLVLLIGFTDYISIWGNGFYTESLAGSNLMFGIAFLFKGFEKQKTHFFLLSGIFFTWLIFLRPFMIAVWGIIVVIIIFYDKKQNFKNRILYVALFVSTFLFIDTIWVVRNYNIENQIIPLQGTVYAGGNPSKSFVKYREFIGAFGGDAVEWNPNSEGMWFQQKSFLLKNNFIQPSDDIFPNIIYSEKFNLDSLKNLRIIYWKTNDILLSKEERESADSLFCIKADSFINEFKSEHSYYYYIGSRFKLLYRFIVHPYTYYLSFTNKNHSLQWVVKSFVYIINSAVMIFGFIALFFFFFKQMLFNGDNRHVLMQITPWFLILFFPIYLRFIEYRFIVLSYPFLAFYLTCVIDNLLKRVLKSNNK